MDGLTIFISVILGASLYGLASWACPEAAIRARRRSGADRGPVPGYSFYPGEAIERRVVGLAGVPWQLVSLESFHGSARRRLVLTARPTEAMSVEQAAMHLDTATRQMMVASGVEVVVIELSDRPDGPSAEGDKVAMRSRDGRGWSGESERVYLAIEVPKDAANKENKDEG